MPGSAPLIHYRNEATDTDLYRTDAAPVAAELPYGGPVGFSMEGNVGFAYTTDVPGAISLQSIGMPSSHTFDYASDPAEIASRQAQGETLFGTVAFLLSTADIRYFERFEPTSSAHRNQPKKHAGTSSSSPEASGRTRAPPGSHLPDSERQSGDIARWAGR